MEASVGILAYGSLIAKPGWEIEEAIVDRKTDVLTPFSVVFARKSVKRGGAPTLVPVAVGGSPVSGQILILNISEQEAKDRLWRREINKVGVGGHYRHSTNPGTNTLVIDRHENFRGISVVLSARFLATISPLTVQHLVKLAIESARREGGGRDGISYLMEAKKNGIVTTLSEPYEQEILRQTETRNLPDALRKIRRTSASE
jgi:cation transport regulator ChaC